MNRLRRDQMALTVLVIAVAASIADAGPEKKYRAQYEELLCERELECIDEEGPGVFVFDCFEFSDGLYEDCKFDRKQSNECVDALMESDCDAAGTGVIIPASCSDVYYDCG